MIDETEKYEQQGHFFYQKGNSLKEQSRDVPYLPGVYYIMPIAKGNIDLVYISKSGSINQDGKFVKTSLLDTLNTGRQSSQKYFENKLMGEIIDWLDIYCFVTMGKRNNDLPKYVEGILMQNYFDVHRKLPKWNTCF